MGAYYCDSSALVKRYANETGTLWVRSLTEPQAGNDIFTAHITGIEVVAAIPGIRLTRDSWNTTIVTQKRPECPSLEAAASGA